MLAVRYQALSRNSAWQILELLDIYAISKADTQILRRLSRSLNDYIMIALSKREPFSMSAFAVVAVLIYYLCRKNVVFEWEEEGAEAMT